MSTIQYNKLVRDRIPEIIEASGKRCVCSTLSDEEYLARLDEKLNEELAEYQESKSMEELADLLNREFNDFFSGKWYGEASKEDGGDG